tara:strand:+ start:1955 stop:2056 length:102 start_codon:yes stop_codon:yes gene_type:complete
MYEKIEGGAKRKDVNNCIPPVAGKKGNGKRENE